MSDKKPEAGVSRFRVGGKVPLNVYDRDRAVFQCHTPEDAAQYVELLNAGDSHQQTAAAEVAKERERCLRHAVEHEDHGEFSCGSGRYGCVDVIAAAIRSGK